ncbi:murein biosynthesis integral membrane protein MurJ, partial [Xanthomonas sp. Kuri4-3]
LVATMFQYGRFTAFSTEMTALSVLGLSFGLPAFALVKVVLPAFYARKDTRTPVRAGVVSLVANMVLNVAFLAAMYHLTVPAEVRDLGVMEALKRTPGLHLALGLASALASYINLGLLGYWLRRSGVYQPHAGWGRFLLRLVLSCAAMGAVVAAGLYWLPDFTGMDKWHRIGSLLGLVAAGGATYAVMQLALGF